MQLVKTEADELTRLETVIQRGLSSFVEVGNALLAIRDGKLYREIHKTFDDYCRDRWNMSRVHAHRLIESAEISENLLPIGNIVPTTESQLRPMSQLAAEQQQAAWAEAVKRTNGKPTAAAVTQAVQDLGFNGEEPPFDPQAFNIWSFADRNPAFGIEYPGNIPGDIIQNLLWLYTEPDSVVIDPFAGGGVTHDVCRWWTEKMWPVLCLSLDAKPSRPEILKNDITKGYPKSAKNAALVFLDPPYWKQKRGDYEGGENLADMPLGEFDSALELIVRNSLDICSPGGHVALLIGATRDGQRFDHAAELIRRLADLELEERIIVPYSTQQAAPYHITAARKGKLLLNRYRDLLIWRK